MTICPNCGYAHAHVDYAPELGEMEFPRREHEAILRLRQANGGLVSFDSMMDAVYDEEPDEEPLIGSLYAHISKIRHKIEPVGWTIKGTRFRGYRLVRVTQ